MKYLCFYFNFLFGRDLQVEERGCSLSFACLINNSQREVRPTVNFPPNPLIPLASKQSFLQLLLGHHLRHDTQLHLPDTLFTTIFLYKQLSSKNFCSYLRSIYGYPIGDSDLFGGKSDQLLQAQLSSLAGVLEIFQWIELWAFWGFWFLNSGFWLAAPLPNGYFIHFCLSELSHEWCDALNYRVSTKTNCSATFFVTQPLEFRFLLNSHNK